jgi:Fe-S cluster assembly ATP-binding protein
MPNLLIKNLHVAIDGKEILKGLNLTVGQGQTHAIMGPNGGGKSTLAQAIMAHPKYEITRGNIYFGKTKINGLTTDKIARLGILMAFQYPQSIPGVSAAHLLKLASRRVLNATQVKLTAFNRRLAQTANHLKLPKEFLHRSLNEGFSGGEKKKTEILQLSLLNPKLVILDETDSGLDVDALKMVGRQVEKLQQAKVSIIIITHYQRILKYIKPDFVHVLFDGRIVKSGSQELASKIETQGYNQILH